MVTIRDGLILTNTVSQDTARLFSTRLAAVTEKPQGTDFGGNGEAGLTAPDILAYTRDTNAFEGMAACPAFGPRVQGRAGRHSEDVNRVQSSGVLELVAPFTDCTT
jgi:hypothetical protein